MSLIRAQTDALMYAFDLKGTHNVNAHKNAITRVLSVLCAILIRLNAEQFHETMSKMLYRIGKKTLAHSQQMQTVTFEALATPFTLRHGDNFCSLMCLQT